MRSALSIWIVVGVITLGMVQVRAQDLDPRAYAHVPVDISFLVGGLTFSGGSIVTDPTLPLKDLEATVLSATLGYGRTFALFGQTAQAFVIVPVSWATASATINGEQQSIDRTGLADARLRLSWLAIGAPATSLQEFGKSPRTTILGISLTIGAPTGQAFSDKLINIGTHRWQFKPEVAMSFPFSDKWLVDLYAAVNMFTDNASFYPGTTLREQDPMAAFQAHVSYTFRNMQWAALNMTYYVGGTSYLNGVAQADQQNNVRVGGTFVTPVGKEHSIKIAASTGAIVRVGANFTTLAVAWQTTFF
jgi:hypothetical protein